MLNISRVSNIRDVRQSKRRGEGSGGERRASDGVIQVWDAADREDQRFIESWLATDFAAVEENGRDPLLFRLLVLRGNEMVECPAPPPLDLSRVKKKKRSNILMRKPHKGERPQKLWVQALPPNVV